MTLDTLLRLHSSNLLTLELSNSPKAWDYVAVELVERGLLSFVEQKALE